MRKHHYLWLGVVIAIIIGAVALVLALRTKAANLDNNASDQGACNQQCETMANQLLDGCKNLVGGSAAECQKNANDSKSLCKSECAANGGGGNQCLDGGMCKSDASCAGGTCDFTLNGGTCVCNGGG